MSVWERLMTRGSVEQSTGQRHAAHLLLCGCEHEQDAHADADARVECDVQVRQQAEHAGAAGGAGAIDADLSKRRRSVRGALWE